MKTEQAVPATIDEYIAGFSPGVQQVLGQIRTAIREAAPGAEEKISYQIPAFTLDRRHLVYFAAHTKHVAVYPAPVENPEFRDDMAVYGSGKGTAKFPLDKPIPFDLIQRIVKFRIREESERAAARGKKKA